MKARLEKFPTFTYRPQLPLASNAKQEVNVVNNVPVPEKDAPPHFYVTFPVTDESSLIICIITSQVETRKEYYRKTNIKAEKCLIQVSNDIFSFLDRKKKSVIDCNQAELLSKEELRRRMNSKIPFEIKERKIPSYLKKDVASAIIQSPLIPKSMKNLIKAKK